MPEYWQQPGRFGRVLNFAIDSYVWVTLSWRFESEVLVSYREVEIAENIAAIKHPLVRKALMKYGLPENHIEVHLVANLPGKGTGLGSSSALAVALVMACREWQGRPPLHWQEKAEEAWQLERAENGPKVGLQDHVAAAKGGLNLFTFHPWRARNIDYWHSYDTENIGGLMERLLLFSVGERSGDGERIMAEMSEKLTGGDGLAYYDQVSLQALDMGNAIARREWWRVGEILHEGWEAKKHFSPQITTPAIDRIYADARQIGATGGKLCGAGGGGFLLLYAEPEYQPALRFALAQSGCRELRFRMAEG